MTNDEFRTEFIRRLQALDPHFNEGDELVLMTDVLFKDTKNPWDASSEVILWNRTQDRTVKVYDRNKMQQIPDLFIDLVTVDKEN